MATSLSNFVELTESDRPGLTALELLGAYFTSQLHDLNNQVSVLANSELLIPTESELTPQLSGFLADLFRAVRRVSDTCCELNDVRKTMPVEPEICGLASSIQTMADEIENHSGWTVVADPVEGGDALINPRWLPFMLDQILTRLPATGEVHIRLGSLPPRQYLHTLRGHFGGTATRALMVHFQGAPGAEVEVVETRDFAIALELIRLLGAAISLQRSDAAHDILLAFRVE